MNGGKTANLFSNKIGQQFLFDRTTGKWVGKGIWGTALANGKVVNTPIVENLTIIKKDSQTNEVLNGAKFNITLENVSSIMGYSSTGGSKIILRDVSAENYAEFVEGILKLERLVIKDQTNPITITIEESEAPLGYKKLDGKIVLTLQRVDENGKFKDEEGKPLNKALRYLQLADVKVEGNISEEEFDVNKFGTLPKNLDDHAISLDIKNIPVMNIGGVVWEDKIVDGKVAQKNNQYDKDAEEFEKIRVELWEGDSFKEFTTTDSDGKYLFKEVVKSDNYKVVFVYDGMTYETVKNSSDSIAEEVARDSFNNKFKTINSETTVDEEKLWSEEYYASYNDETVKTKLETSELTADNVKNPKTIFKMTAQVKVNDHLDENGIDATNINCGLTDRYFDLALGLDVSAATVTINGKSTAYTYEQILTANEIENAKENASTYLSMRLDKEGNLNQGANGHDIQYNLYLYESDYNYRINDYRSGGIKNEVNDSHANEFKTRALNNDNEMQIFVIYKALVYNQSSENGYATKVINYVPEHYEFFTAFIGDDYIGYDNDDTDDFEPIIYEGSNVIINLTDKDGNLISKTGERTQELTIMYKVKKDDNGQFVFPEDRNLDNSVEIYEYYSEKGIIDYDSAPGNNREKEDDIDGALPLKVSVDNKERTISGNVFEDINKDGYNNDSKLINDVIVQLIELKTIGNNTFEYIWQETVSGSNIVKRLSEDGTAIVEETYRENSPNDGSYEFSGFIPGNYIIRFIYGDGRTYELTQNHIKYNGQDYKSSYMKGETEGQKNYMREWYNNTSYVENTTKATDNPNRRLKVMDYSEEINNDIGTKLNYLNSELINLNDEQKEKVKAVLDETWMCAETAQINILVDNGDNVVEDEDKNSNTLYYNTANTVKFTDISLGLMERPKMKLTLEKRITGLEIKNASGTLILAANLEADGNVKVNVGEKSDLAKMPTDREKRGYWEYSIGIDETENLNRADVWLTYEYVLKNEGERDYLNKNIVDNGNLKMPEDNINRSQLSEFYYTGSPDLANETLINANINEIQEIVNPKVGYDAGTFSKQQPIEETQYSVYDVEGNLKTIKDVYNAETEKITSDEVVKLTPGDSNNEITAKFKTNIDRVELLSKKDGGIYHSFIAEITKYSTPTGRRCENSTPGNLAYVHSEDNSKTMEQHELDEFWGDTFRITVDTGDDKQTPMQIAIIIVSAVAIVGVGIILIKKFVLKK